MSTVGTADAGGLSREERGGHSLLAAAVQEEKGGHTLGDSTAASSVAPQTSQMPQGGEFEVCAAPVALAAHAAHAASAAHAHAAYAAHAAHAALTTQPAPS